MIGWSDKMGDLKKIFLCVFVVSVWACSGKMAATLEIAGDNRKELEKVLEHYLSTGDRQKWEAAAHRYSLRSLGKSPLYASVSFSTLG